MRRAGRGRQPADEPLADDPATEFDHVGGEERPLITPKSTITSTIRRQWTAMPGGGIRLAGLRRRCRRRRACRWINSANVRTTPTIVARIAGDVVSRLEPPMQAATSASSATACFSEAQAHEPVRRVVGAPGRSAGFEQPGDRDERGVEIGTAARMGKISVARSCPRRQLEASPSAASAKPIAWLPGRP